MQKNYIFDVKDEYNIDYWINKINNKLYLYGYITPGERYQLKKTYLKTYEDHELLPYVKYETCKIKSVFITPKLVVDVDNTMAIRVDRINENNEMKCSHCNKSRKNSKIYTFLDPDKKEFYLMNACVPKYFSRKIYELEFLDWGELEDILDSFNNPESFEKVKVVSLEDAVMVANAIIKQFGYVKKDTHESSADRLLNWFFSTDVAKDFHYDLEKEDALQKTKLVSNIKELFEYHMDPENNWVNNVKGVLDHSFVRLKDFGILVSAVNAYIEDEKQKAINKRFKNNFFSVVGTKVKDCNAVVVDKKTFLMNNYYNYSNVEKIPGFKIVFDCDGHRLIWITSSKNIPEVGHEIIFDAKIKNHEIRDSVYTTYISRVSWSSLNNWCEYRTISDDPK